MNNLLECAPPLLLDAPLCVSAIPGDGAEHIVDYQVIVTIYSTYWSWSESVIGSLARERQKKKRHYWTDCALSDGMFGNLQYNKITGFFICQLDDPIPGRRNTNDYKLWLHNNVVLTREAVVTTDSLKH